MTKYIKDIGLFVLGWALVPAVTGTMVGLAGADADLVRAISIGTAIFYPVIALGVLGTVREW
jgi:hypothetical protein